MAASSTYQRLSLFLAATAAVTHAGFVTIDTNEDLQLGVAWGGLDSDTFFTGGGRSGDPNLPEVGCGLLVTRDNGTHWELEVPGGGDYVNPFPMAYEVASN